MLGVAWAVILNASASGAAAACPPDEHTEHHLSDVCASHLGGAPAYAVTMRGSLIPKPASQQILIYEFEDQWYIRVAGFRWERAVVETRRVEIPIDEEDAAILVALVSDAKLERLAELPYYGEEGIFCMDGEAFELAKAQSGQRRFARQHSCAGTGELSSVAAEFRRVALEYDPESEGLLTAFRP